MRNSSYPVGTVILSDFTGLSMKDAAVIIERNRKNGEDLEASELISLLSTTPRNA